MKPQNTPPPIPGDCERLAAVVRLETALRLKTLAETKGYANAVSPADAAQVECHFDLRTERVAPNRKCFDVILPRFAVDLVLDDVCPAPRALRPLAVAAILTGWPVGLLLIGRVPV